MTIERLIPPATDDDIRALAGLIPRYAFDTGGKTPHDAVVFYKELS